MRTSERSPDRLLLEKCEALLREMGVDGNADLATELMYNAVRMAQEDPGRGEMKLMARALRELRYGFRTFKPYRNRRKISMFGSARTPPDDPDYRVAEQFGALAAAAGFMVITGAGGGIMEAGNEGAGIANSFGVAIRLPFEQTTNPIVAGDDKLVHFRYFFSRKLIFVKETHAVALFPGGFGTHDEGFEVLTLVQTGRCDPLPLVMVEHIGGDYWRAWDEFVRNQMLAKGLISPEDTSLYHLTEDPQDAVDHIARFYRNYHSLRYVGSEMVFRLAKAPGNEALDEINCRFSDILSQGTFRVMLAREIDREWTEPQTPCLVFHFNRRSLSRLRMLIDFLNSLPGLPNDMALSSQVGAECSDRGVATIADDEPIIVPGPAVT